MFLKRLAQQIKSIVMHVMGKVEAWVKPRTEWLVVGVWMDMTRSKGELIAENALQRQETTWSIVALTNWLLQTGELRAN